jgi:hypothetical protein
MSQTAEFWQYAEEAMLSARKSKSEIEKRGLMDLARTCAQAAMQSETTVGVNGCPPETKAAAQAISRGELVWIDMGWPTKNYVKLSDLIQKLTEARSTLIESGCIPSPRCQHPRAPIKVYLIGAYSLSPQSN